MELSSKEKSITLAALIHYMGHLEAQLASGGLSEGDEADITNDATLLEIVIAAFEAELRRTT